METVAQTLRPLNNWRRPYGKPDTGGLLDFWASIAYMQIENPDWWLDDYYYRIDRLTSVKIHIARRHLVILPFRQPTYLLFLRTNKLQACYHRYKKLAGETRAPYSSITREMALADSYLGYNMCSRFVHFYYGGKTAVWNGSSYVFDLDKFERETLLTFPKKQLI